MVGGPDPFLAAKGAYQEKGSGNARLVADYIIPLIIIQLSGIFLFQIHITVAYSIFSITNSYNRWMLKCNTRWPVEQQA